MNTVLLEHNQHYAPGNADAAVAAALATLYNNTARSIEELAALDQFHTGGLEASRALAKRAAITASDRVLDVGGGLGGPARMLAHESGCEVTVLDLTESYVRIGRQLTEEANLTDRVRFQQGDALDMPFEDGSFDVVWTQHSTMNIPDKTRLYTQIHRVLRPGGRHVLYEVAAGSGEPIHLPTPWAHSESMNFLVSPATLHESVIQAGFREVSWTDMTDWAKNWFAERQRPQQNAGTPQNPLGLHLLVGADNVRTMMGNFARNLQEGRVRIVEGIFERVSMPLMSSNLLNQ